MIITLTEDLIRAGMKSGLGIKRIQAAIIDVPWPLAHGWLRMTIGTQISQQEYRRFVAFSGDEFRKKKGRCKRSRRSRQALRERQKKK